LTLAGGTVEVQGHQGALILTSRDSEVALADLLGQVECAVTGGSLLLQRGVGPFQGRLVDALLRIDDWRGTVLVEGSGATVEARALGVRMEIKGEGHAIAIDELQGFLLAELGGGSLTATKLFGQAQITAGGGAEIAIDGIQGQAMLTLENSSARLAGVAGQLTAGVDGGRLEVDRANGLQLVAAGAEIVVRRLQRLLKAEATDSRLDLDFWELNHDPTLTLQGSSEARVRMRTPCSVKLGEVQLLGGGVDVTGCALHSQTLRRARQERVGVDGNRRLTLSVNLGQASTLKVEGAP